MDRRTLKYDEDKNSFFIETFDKSLIRISGTALPKVNRISIRARFINNEEIKVLEYHVNNEWFRDGASYFGIFLIFIFFVKNIFYPKKIMISLIIQLNNHHHFLNRNLQKNCEQYNI